MSEHPLIQCRNLCKDYFLGGEVIHALRDITVSIGEGEFVAVLGRSGSGKSTFLHLLGALDVPTSGELIFDGQSISSLAADELAAFRNSKVGFVFQQFNLLGRTNALNNVQLPLLYSGLTREERQVKSRECLAMVGLLDRMDHRPSQLSGGQQQRVALARALVNEPRVIFADEPTGALDTRTGEEIMELLSRLNREGITVVIVTHEADIAAHAGRQLRFEDGHLVDDTRSPSSAAQSPKTDLPKEIRP